MAPRPAISIPGVPVRLGILPLLWGPLLVALTAASAGAQEPPRRPIQIDDLFRIASVGEPVVSPDGSRVAYTLSSEDLDENSGHTDVWMLELPDGEPRPMTRGTTSSSAPAFSPDGRYLSFLSSRGEVGSQVWVLDLDGGEARPLTHLDRDVRDYAWAPDGGRLALLLRDDGPEQEEGEPRPPWVIDRIQFKQDYRGYLDRRRAHLYALDLGSGDLTALTSGDYDDGSMAWSPDGSTVAFVSNRSDEPDTNYDNDVWLVSAHADGSDAAPRRLSSGAGSDGGPVWSPDGEAVAWLTSLRPEIGGYAMSHLAVRSPDGRTRVLTEGLDRSVRAPRFTEDGDRILALLESEGAQLLLSFPVSGSAPDTLWGGRRRVSAFATVPGGGVVARASSADAPAELWLLRESAAPRRLTGHNDTLLETLDLGAVTKESVRAPDGTELEAFYTFPPGVDRASASELPTILWIHGGPMGQDDWGWDGLRHLFAAHGYLVIQPNYRGSHGYGQEFALGLWQDWGGPERMDAVASVDHAIERGWADSTRLGVGGWSYGAITTNAIITHTDRFEAAISGAGAALHVASWGHDQYQRWYAYELGFPWENRELWERLSPFNRVEHITTPTLWMGGERDWNVPILQSELMYQSMKYLGRETLLVVYPGQGHGGFPPVYEADRYRRFLGWFGRYLMGDDSVWPDP